MTIDDLIKRAQGLSIFGLSDGGQIDGPGVVFGFIGRHDDSDSAFAIYPVAQARDLARKILAEADEAEQGNRHVDRNMN